MADTTGTRLTRNTVFNLLGLGLPVVVALAALPVLARALDAAAFGLLAIAWLVHGYANELGFGRATTKFAAECARDGSGRALARVAWSTFVLQTALGVVAGATLLLLTPILAERVLRVPPALMDEATSMFRLLAATIPVIVLSATMRGLLEALQRFDLVNAVRAPASAATFVAPLLGLGLGWNVAGMVALLLVSRILALIAYGVLSVLLVPSLRRANVSLSDLRRIAVFGGWVSVSGLLSPLLIYLDRFLVGALVSVAAVAYYTAPYEVVTRLLIVPASMVAALFPELSALHGRGELRRLAELAARGLRQGLLIIGPAAVLLIGLAPDLLRVLLGTDYAIEGAIALQILAAGTVVNAVAHIPVTMLHAVGRPEVPARFHLLELPLHTVVAVLLISQWGVPGAAAAWALRAVIDAGLLMWASARAVPAMSAAVQSERIALTATLLFGFALVSAGATQFGAAWTRVSAVIAIACGLGFALWWVAIRGRGQLAHLPTPAGAS